MQRLRVMYVCALALVAAVVADDAIRHTFDAATGRVVSETGSARRGVGAGTNAYLQSRAAGRERGTDAFGAAVTPVFSVNLQYAVYTSATVLRAGATAPVEFTAADWLNPPYETVAYDAAGNAVWSDTTSANRSETVSIRSVSARFASAPNPKQPLAVDVVTGMEEDVPDASTTCVIVGLSSKASGPATPVWAHTIEQCYADFIDSLDNLKISDDGSTVALSIITNETLPDATVGPHRRSHSRGHARAPQSGVTTTLQLRVLNAQTGAFLYGYAIPGTDFYPRGVSLSADGRFVQISSGGNSVTSYVFDSTKGTLRGSVNVGLTLSTAISPDGMYLAAGYQQLSVYQWSATQKEYQTLWSASNGAYLLYDCVISAHAGKPLVSAGWINGQATGVSVQMYGLNSSPASTPLWTWVGPTNEQDQNIVSYMSAAGQYVAVATWGSYNEAANPSPTVLLFGSASNSTLLSYITAGSMFAVDVVAPAGANAVYVVAAGKHVQANTMGNGGDLYAFKVNV